AHPTASSLKKLGTKKKRLGRKGVHTSHSTISIEEGYPDAEHKLCIKYASDEDSASDYDTLVHLYAVVDWELLPTGLGSINAIFFWCSCVGDMGNELTTAVQLIAFLKKQIFDSKCPKVHEWVINSPCYHNKELASLEQTAIDEVVPKSVAGLSFPAASSMMLPFDVQVQQDF
ncbi:hypothetical protein Tco_1341495, partial [Tanacetum coccineum]